ncbi:MAG: diguanylate cyclase domain-containing protein [Nitrincola lacisaponensis]|uniref:diguanylate cyclase domain-containing protein n=1 Tax=Nitrincola lacisaponensis TaxID=267850 RepID=UPI0039193E0D
MTKRADHHFRRDMPESRWSRKSLSHDRSLQLQDRSLLQELQMHQIELEMQNEQLRKAQSALEEVRDRYTDLFEFAPVSYITLNQDGRICEANFAAATLLAIDSATLVGQHFSDLLDSKDAESWLRYMHAGWKVPRCHLPELELLIRGRGERLFPAELHCMVTDRSNVPATMRIALFDTTERQALAAEMAHYAYFDSLTQLPNRRLFQDRLSHAVLTSQRSGEYGAILFLDLDGFKLLNDTHGHATGDQMLIEIAQRLRTSLREGDTVARIGGDEFVMILERLDRSESGAALSAQEVGEKLKRGVAHVFEPDGISVKCTASIGVRLFGPAAEVNDLLKQADQALYQAKRAGRNQISFFSDSG